MVRSVSDFKSRCKFRRISADNFGNLRTEPSLESKCGMVQNDPRARHITTIKMKKEKKNVLFGASLGVLPMFCHFRAIFISEKCYFGISTVLSELG